MTGTVRYLSAVDIAALALDPALARAAIGRAFKAYHAGEAVSRPKLVIDVGPCHAFQSLVAASSVLGLAANKWLGLAPASQDNGAPGIDALIAVNDFATGRLVAILDGKLITGIRTAAMSAFAAASVARRDSKAIGFVGCGLQAHMHLDAMKSLLPGLTTVLALGRNRDSAKQFAAYAAAGGFHTELTDDAEALAGRSDIIVTSVPMCAGFTPFLDPDWIQPGAFVAAIDMARSWHPEKLRSLDIVLTDDHQQQAHHPIYLGSAPWAVSMRILPSLPLAQSRAGDIVISAPCSFSGASRWLISRWPRWFSIWRGMEISARCFCVEWLAVGSFPEISAHSIQILASWMIRPHFSSVTA